jgi:hypothetical protein
MGEGHEGCSHHLFDDGIGASGCRGTDLCRSQFSRRADEIRYAVSGCTAALLLDAARTHSGAAPGLWLYPNSFYQPTEAVLLICSSERQRILLPQPLR